MKNYKLVSFVLVVLSLTIYSCRPKPIKLDVEPAPEKLVVYSHLIPDKVMIITLTKSFSALNGFDESTLESLLVSGATIKVKFDGQVFDFIEINPGIYASYNEAYEYNQEYELEIVSGEHTVTSKTIMLPQIDFTSCLPQVDKFATDTNVYVNLAFDDEANKSNWYLINFYNKNAQTNSLDGVNFFQNGTNNLMKTILVSDKEFSGSYIKKVELENASPTDSIAVTLSNINEKYFDYLKIRSTSGGSILNQLNIEPISYPSNIVNGYGFFNAYFPDIKFYDLGQF